MVAQSCVLDNLCHPSGEKQNEIEKNLARNVMEQCGIGKNIGTSNETILLFV